MRTAGVRAWPARALACLLASSAGVEAPAKTAVRMMAQGDKAFQAGAYASP